MQDVAHNFMKTHQRSNKNTNEINRLYYLAFKTKNKTRMKLLKGLDTLFKTLKSSFCVQFFKIKPRVQSEQL